MSTPRPQRLSLAARQRRNGYLFVAAPGMLDLATFRRLIETAKADAAQQRFDNQCVVVRVLDPARARWYAEQGLQTVCPTQTAIELLEGAVRGHIRFEGVSG